MKSGIRGRKTVPDRTRKKISRGSATFGLTFLLVAFGLLAWGFSSVRGAPLPQAAVDPPTIAAFNKGGCATCHTIPGIPNAAGVVGPDLSAIGEEGGQRISGVSTEDYIRESILDPDAFLAPECPLGPCPDNVMPPNLADKLSTGDLDLIVAYLAALTGGAAPEPELYVLVPIEIVRPVEAHQVPFAEPPRTYSDGQVLLGKFLFFDPRLSGNTSLSCTSCHQPDLAWADGQPLSAGYPSTSYFRNAPSVMNTVYLEWLYWDGRMDGGDFPTLVRDHLTEAHFMNMDGRLMVERLKQVPEYVQLFEDAFGSPPSFGGVLNAIAAYVHSLNSSASPFDRFLAGDQSALSPDAEAGMELFMGPAGCASCHTGPAFTDGNFYALGVEDNAEVWADALRHITFRRFFRQLGVPDYRDLQSDPGLYALTKDLADWGAFRTAPLREVSRTAPYMHNGSLSTLEDVVRFYNAGAVVGMPLGLSNEQIRQLVAFLESLSSEPVAVEAPALPDYQIRTLGENR